MAPWSSLRTTIAGDVVEAGAPDWDAARQAWNLVADQHPAAVVRAAAPADLAATLRFAAANGLRVAPQTTGHSATTLGDLSDAILLRTGALAAVTVDPGARTARVQAGARWRRMSSPRRPSTGSPASTAPRRASASAGYTLGGGLGWLARSHGFASTFVRSLTVVTADGEAAPRRRRARAGAVLGAARRRRSRRRRRRARARARPAGAGVRRHADVAARAGAGGGGRLPGLDGDAARHRDVDDQAAPLPAGGPRARAAPRPPARRRDARRHRRGRRRARRAAARRRGAVHRPARHGPRHGAGRDRRRPGRAAARAQRLAAARPLLGRGGCGVPRAGRPGGRQPVRQRRDPPPRRRAAVARARYRARPGRSRRRRSSWPSGRRSAPRWARRSRPAWRTCARRSRRSRGRARRC